MSKGINKVILIGRSGKDPEVRNLPNGGQVTTLSLATSDSWRDKNTGQKVERTEWHKVIFFNRLAEIAAQYLKKGAMIYVEGSIKTRKWQDNNGQDRYTTEIVAKELQMLDSRGGAQEQSNAPSPGQQADDVLRDEGAEPKQHSVNDAQGQALDDDIPF